MAYPTAVNSQITDSVSQAGVVTLGSAPAVALASLYQAVAQTIAMAAHNATFAQQQAYITAQAATAQGVALIYAQANTLHSPAAMAPVAESQPAAGPVASGVA
ncbi:hypothetical protein J2X47_003017 [Sphingomonas sp. BE270]|jgi:hypothetical protein|uniref:RebB family R body protein n=1 Tax=unclassified Sphingomonas TaxID=196159 RepID=UPI0010F5B571|nr:MULTISPECIES: RebB family R body protein [unclassified Sphingomonas]MDR6849552.1 hypothetical protein [Sphingomonas sp. BE137]MDR7258827.1 hypothetical protein [Sphingomonas sp. BE270]